MKFSGIGDAAHARSPQFLAAVQRLSQDLALDFDRIADGCPMRYEGITFWLNEYGALDRDGLTLMIDLGELPARNQLQFCRQLLEFNYVVPAGLQGYCALMPGSNVIAQCIRIDFDKVPDPAGAIYSILRTMTERKDEIGALVQVETARFSSPRVS